MCSGKTYKDRPLNLVLIVKDDKIKKCNFDTSTNIPRGAVMSFFLPVCPDGWSPFNESNNRAIVGSGGTYSLGQTGGGGSWSVINGSALDVGGHTHAPYIPIVHLNMATVCGGAKDCSATQVVGEQDHTHSVAANENSGGHGHHVDVTPPPFISLLYGKKD